MVENRKLWKNFLSQSFLAAVTVFLVLFVITIENSVVIAAIGATAFIVFAMPKSITARPRNVIGGHLIGLTLGSLCALIPQQSFLHSAFAYSLAVGLSTLTMVVTDTKHPPAASTALGVAITGFSLSVVTAVITSIILLSLAHRILRPFLKDLV